MGGGGGGGGREREREKLTQQTLQNWRLVVNKKSVASALSITALATDSE